MAYLCLYKVVKQWKDIETVGELMKLHLPGCQPNQIAVKNVIMKNQIFQNQQKMTLSINRLRSADSISDLRILEKSMELSDGLDDVVKDEE